MLGTEYLVIMLIILSPNLWVMQTSPPVCLSSLSSSYVLAEERASSQTSALPYFPEQTSKGQTEWLTCPSQAQELISC